MRWLTLDHPLRQAMNTPHPRTTKAKRQNTMDFELTEEQRAFAQTARDFAQAELAPHAAHWDEEGIFPKEAIAKAGEPGLRGLYAPEAAAGGLRPAPAGCHPGL